MADDSLDDGGAWLLNLPPTLWQRRAAYCVGVALLIGFAVSIPFAAVALPRVDGFIPVVEALMFLTDFITAVLLYSQLSIYRSKTLLILANGYFFTALIIIPHLASYPGVFAPAGLLGATVDTTAWLYYLWHLGLPVTLLIYTYFRRWKDKQNISEGAVQSAIVSSIFLVIALVCTFSWFAFKGTGALPHLFADTTRSAPFLFYIGGIGFLIALVGTVAIWIVGRSVLDLWLLVVGVAATSEVGLITVGTARFTAGFYAGRIFALVTSTTVLVVLLSETTKLYSRLARSHAILQRERDNKLMNIEAVTASIAHEMAQPLAAIATNGDAAVEFLANAPPDIDRACAALNDMIEDSHRSGKALDGIRALFRKVDQSRQPVDMNEIALDVLQSLRGELRDNAVAYSPQLETSLPLIKGNKGQLQQVVLNLVHNAVEAMASTSNKDRMLRLVTERRGEGAIVLGVRDSGPGINPTQLEVIFDAFVSTKANGMGLGLAICRTIVERHGGELTASSDGKDGSLFEVVLPINCTPDPAVRVE
jgi:signal transduction histidine kinase